jgi:hypothetical protein
MDSSGRGILLEDDQQCIPKELDGVRNGIFVSTRVSLVDSRLVACMSAGEWVSTREKKGGVRVYLDDVSSVELDDSNGEIKVGTDL